MKILILLLLSLPCWGANISGMEEITLGAIGGGAGCNDRTISGTVGGVSTTSVDMVGALGVHISLGGNPGASGCTFTLQYATLTANQCRSDVVSFTEVSLGTIDSTHQTLDTTVSVSIIAPAVIQVHVTGSSTLVTAGGSMTFWLQGPGPMHFQATGGAPGAGTSPWYMGQVNSSQALRNRLFWINNTGKTLIRASGVVAVCAAPGSGQTWTATINYSTNAFTATTTCEDLTYATAAGASISGASAKLMHWSTPSVIAVPDKGCIQIILTCTGAGNCASLTSGGVHGGLDVSENASMVSAFQAYESAGSGAFDSNHMFDVGTWAISDAENSFFALDQQYWRAPLGGLSAVSGSMIFADPTSGTGQYNFRIKYSDAAPTSTQGCLQASYSTTGTLATMSNGQGSATIPWTAVPIPSGACFAFDVTTSGGTPANASEWNWQLTASNLPNVTGGAKVTTGAGVSVAH